MQGVQEHHPLKIIQMADSTLYIAEKEVKGQKLYFACEKIG